MNEKLKSQCRTLYEQCLEVYKNSLKTSILKIGSDGENIPVPSIFDDQFRVPEELLFTNASKANHSWLGERQNFSWELLTHLYRNEKFDEKWIIDKNKEKISLKTYIIYFEVFYFEDTAASNHLSKPFSGTLKIKDIRFNWCAKQEFANVSTQYIKQERQKDGGHLIDTIKSTKFFRRFASLSEEQEKFVHPIKAAVMASNPLDAAEKALAAFAIFANCFNVAQAKGRLKLRLDGGDPRTIDSKTTMVDTGVYFVKDEGSISYYNSGTHFNHLPKNYFDPSSEKQKLCKKILTSVMSESSIKDRIGNVVRELAMSYDTEDSGARQLGFWRCLEHATRKSGGNRKEKEIIDIFKNYRKEQYWKQMGDNVLKIRNGYVHEGNLLGEDEARDSYINWSQKYAEAALNILLYLFKSRSKWNTAKKIDEFFDYYSRTDESLKTASMILSDKNKSLSQTRSRR